MRTKHSVIDIATLRRGASRAVGALKLLGDESPTFESRAHFFAVAARVMRQILVDHARKHLSQKRGGGVATVPLDWQIANRHCRSSSGYCAPRASSARAAMARTSTTA